MASLKLAKSCSASAGITRSSTRCARRAAHSCGNACSVRNAASSAAPERPRPPWSNTRSTRHAGGKARREMTGGWPPPAAAPAVDDEAALLEGADADPGPRAAVRERRERGQRDRNVEQRAECRADCERELRAGSEADMLGNRALHLDGAAGGRHRIRRRDGGDSRAPGVRIRAVRLEPSARRSSTHGRELVERETEAAEAAAEAAAHVDEAEMQARRRPDSHRSRSKSTPSDEPGCWITRGSRWSRGRGRPRECVRSRRRRTDAFSGRGNCGGPRLVCHECTGLQVRPGLRARCYDPRTCCPDSRTVRAGRDEGPASRRRGVE